MLTSSAELTRPCPVCESLLSYSCYPSWHYAASRNQICRDCSHRLRRENNDIQICQLHTAGMTLRQIGEEIGAHHGTVSRRLRALGLCPNGKATPLKMIDSDSGECNKCSKVKPLREFLVNRRGKKYEYRFAYCLQCRKKQLYLNINGDIKKFLSNRYHRLVQRAEKYCIPLSMTKQELFAIYESQAGRCFYTDELLVWGVGMGKSPNALSIDKVNPTLGYATDNVVLCTTRANTVKHNLSLDEMRKWLPEWYQRLALKFQHLTPCSERIAG
jgi:hypothetical protein